jgi:hypothetical protein
MAGGADILYCKTKKLNVHLFDALRKALYKPAAFFKGKLSPAALNVVRIN